MNMTININTKIATLLKHNPAALEAIVSLSPKFIKLRNPLLRKVIAGRTSISMASKLGGCSVDAFFTRLIPLGFEIDKEQPVKDHLSELKPVPEFLKDLPADKVIDLDVRPVIENGEDPLNLILQNVKLLERGSVLKIINSFEPTPLRHLLHKQGFESYTEQAGEEQVNTYFYKIKERPIDIMATKTDYSGGWNTILNHFKDNLETIDVRQLEMPMPMHMILKALETLDKNKALFVYHKRIPVFLLPELEDRNFSSRIKEVSNTEVNLLIYKD
jgi:uncharacterized protein (DUF2249 family)